LAELGALPTNGSFQMGNRDFCFIHHLSSEIRYRFFHISVAFLFPCYILNLEEIKAFQTAGGL
jgi:hypothetical protein